MPFVKLHICNYNLHLPHQNRPDIRLYNRFHSWNTHISLELYQKLRQIRAANSENISEETKEFRETYTKFKANTKLGKEQARSVVGKSDKFRELYLNVVLEKKLDGTIRTDENGVAVPNMLLYGYLTLKDDLSEEEKNRFIDKQRQEDLNLIDKSYKTVHTKYWEKALAYGEKDVFLQKL